MKQLYKQGLFIFHRDLRLQDNRGLNQALQECASVIPCFIFDTRQVENNNKYKSFNAIQFMLSCLQELDHELHKHKSNLFLFHGLSPVIIKKLIKEHSIQAIYSNRDYTPFSQKRDQEIQEVCLHYGIPFISLADALLHEPEEIQSSSNKPYQKFTPFFNNSRSFHIPEPVTVKQASFYTQRIPTAETFEISRRILKTSNNTLWVQGGRKEALNILKKLGSFTHYSKTRNYPSLSTTYLSAFNKFGPVSIREVFHAIKQTLGATHELLKQLYWRDFFYHIAHHNPHVFGNAFQEKFNNINWEFNSSHFNAWCTGQTGFPIVDAGMRQLNETGWMHNRVRMITASFLTKDLHISWHEGERYFAQKLVDYDPCVNNGNWQWAASTGCDAQPYFRIFNPWEQQKKFDPDGKYIKKWVPELKTLSPGEIHKIHLPQERHKNYISPIINHAHEREKALAMFKKVKKIS